MWGSASTIDRMKDAPSRIPLMTTIRISVDTSDPLDALALPKRKIMAATTADTGPPVNPASGTRMTLNPRTGSARCLPECRDADGSGKAKDAADAERKDKFRS